MRIMAMISGEGEQVIIETRNYHMIGMYFTRNYHMIGMYYTRNYHMIGMYLLVIIT